MPGAGRQRGFRMRIRSPCLWLQERKLRGDGEMQSGARMGREDELEGSISVTAEEREKELRRVTRVVQCERELHYISSTTRMG